jgi:hypothetical protein
MAAEVEDLARLLFREDDPTGIFEAADYGVQLHYRRAAQQKLAAALYTHSPELVR